MPTNRLSDRNCSICKFPLDNDLTTEEIRLKYQGKYYHRSCKALADEFTDNVPSQLADILRRTKKRAPELGLEFELGETDNDAMRFLLDMWEQQAGLCAETGLEMRCDVEHELTFHLKPSLDRIDSSRGYTKQNVQLITQWAQYAKSDLSQEQFDAFCVAKIEHKRGSQRHTGRAKTVASSKPTKTKASSRGKSAAI
jgi:hypothetical protein